MATTGRTAWAKYFNSSSEIPTILRKDSSRYNAETTLTEGVVKKGVSLIFINEGEYQSKALVKEGNEIYRVPFNNLAKPGNKASNRADLKPQAFGIKEKEYSFDQIRDVALDTMSERQDLSGEVKGYLELLLLYHSEGTLVTDAQLKEAYEPIKRNASIQKAIINDFGELLGPFGVYAHSLIDKATNNKIKIPANAKSWFPARPNEPLMDYGIYVGTGKNRKLITISAKALSKTTNVVKPKDILDLIDKKDGGSKAKLRWKNTVQYKILTILNDNSIANGPPLAAAELVETSAALKKKYPGLTKKAAQDMARKGNNYDVKLWSTFIQKNETVQKRPNKRGKVDQKVIRYACEKILQSECHHGNAADMREIFADAIAGRVFYVKFTINNVGMPEWDIATDKNFRNADKACLRTKNGYTRAGDRMGVQP